MKKIDIKQKAEKLADKIATGKRQFVTVDRDMLLKVGKIFEKKYNGEFAWFGLGNAICIRKSKAPFTLKSTKVKAK